MPAPIIDSAVLPVGVWTEGAGNDPGAWVSERLVLTVSTDPATGQIISADLTAEQRPDQAGGVLYLRRPASAPRQPTTWPAERPSPVETVFAALNRKVLARTIRPRGSSANTQSSRTLARLDALLAEAVRDVNRRRSRRR